VRSQSGQPTNRDDRPHAWTDWYRFARDELGLAHDERVEYANLRYVEEQNRELLRRAPTAAPRRDPGGRPRPRFHA
jgi:hypothetical protein